MSMCDPLQSHDINWDEHVNILTNNNISTSKDNINTSKRFGKLFSTDEISQVIGERIPAKTRSVNKYA